MQEPFADDLTGQCSCYAGALTGTQKGKSK